MTPPMGTVRAHRLARRAMVAGSVMLASLTGCDPCSGVARCASSQPYLAATGQLVEKVTDAGVDGARIDVIRTGGVAVDRDSVSTTTLAGGFWRVEFTPVEAGSMTVDVQVRPPGVAPYRVRGLVLSTRAHGGDANLNQTWVTRPYFNYAGELFLNGTVDDRIQNRPITFRITGGVPTRGTAVQDSVYHSTTDVGGRVELFPQREEGGLLPLGADELVGDLTVDLGAPLGLSVVRGIHLAPSYVLFDAGRIARFAVGP